MPNQIINQLEQQSLTSKVMIMAVLSLSDENERLTK